jgi:hypothetical protein
MLKTLRSNGLRISTVPLSIFLRDAIILGVGGLCNLRRIFDLQF